MRTAFFLSGELIEVDNTEKIFTAPSDQRTDGYIRGKFGVMPKIATKNLNLWYGDFHALKNINADFERKEDHRYHRPSGCGKSRCCACLIG